MSGASGGIIFWRRKTPWTAHPCLFCGDRVVHTARRVGPWLLGVWCCDHCFCTIVRPRTPYRRAVGSLAIAEDWS